MGFYDKYNELGKETARKNREIASQLADEQRAAGEAAARSQQQAIDNYSQILNQGEANVANDNQAATQGFYDAVVNPIIAEQQRADAENESLLKSQYDTARWTGVTELAASIANLAGVANGASNQTYHRYSKDWMQKADADSKERRAKIDQLREKQRNANLQALQMKLQGKNAIENLRMQNAGKLAGMQADLANTQYKNAAQVASTLAGGQQAAANAEAEAQMKGLAAQENAANRAAQHAMQREQIKANMQGRGMYQDEKGDWQFSGVNPYYAGSRYSSGSGSNKSYPLVLKGANGLPNEVIIITDDSLNSLYANINNISDLSDEAKKDIERTIMSQNTSMDKISQAIMKYAAESEQVREILRATGNPSKFTTPPMAAAESFGTNQPKNPFTDKNL